MKGHGCVPKILYLQQQAGGRQATFGLLVVFPNAVERAQYVESEYVAANSDSVPRQAERPWASHFLTVSRMCTSVEFSSQLTAKIR